MAVNDYPAACQYGSQCSSKGSTPWTVPGQGGSTRKHQARTICPSGGTSPQPIALLAPSARSASAPGVHAQRGSRAHQDPASTQFTWCHVSLTAKGAPGTQRRTGGTCKPEGSTDGPSEVRCSKPVPQFPHLPQHSATGEWAGRGERSSPLPCSQETRCVWGVQTRVTFLAPSFSAAACAPALQHPVAGTQDRGSSHWGWGEQPPEASLPGRALTEPSVLVRRARRIRKELRLRGQGHSLGSQGRA